MDSADSERRPHFPQFSYSASGREWCHRITQLKEPHARQSPLSPPPPPFSHSGSFFVAFRSVFVGFKRGFAQLGETRAGRPTLNSLVHFQLVYRSWTVFFGGGSMISIVGDLEHLFFVLHSFKRAVVGNKPKMLPYVCGSHQTDM